MAIDLGDIPTGTPPTAGEKLQIRKAIGLGQTDAPTFLAQSLAGQSLTGTQATSLVDLATTWLSTTGTPTAIKLNVTDTASNAASNLMDLQVDGLSKFKVSKAGAVTAGGSISGTLVNASSSLRITSDTGSLVIGGSGDLTLFRDAAGILAQRNGVAKQTLRIYNTYTSASIYERAVMDWNGPTPNTLQIGTEFTGAGMAACPIDFMVGGVVRMSIATSGNATLTGSLTIGQAAVFAHSGRVLLSSPSVGVYLLQNNTQNDFGRIQLGGTTSAFPAIKRNGTGIDIRLADDSAFAPVKGKITTDTNYTVGAFSPTGFLTLYDATGTAYKVACSVYP